MTITVPRPADGALEGAAGALEAERRGLEEVVRVGVFRGGGFGGPPVSTRALIGVDRVVVLLATVVSAASSASPPPIFASARTRMATQTKAIIPNTIA